MVDFFIFGALVELPFLIVAMSMPAYLLSGFSTSLKFAKQGYGGQQVPDGQSTGGGGSINTGGGGYSPSSFDYSSYLNSLSRTLTRSSGSIASGSIGGGGVTGPAFGSSALGTSDLFPSFTDTDIFSIDTDFLDDFTTSFDFDDLFSSLSNFNFNSKREPIPAPTPVKRAASGAPTPAPPMMNKRNAAAAAEHVKRATIATSISQLRSRLSAMVALYTLLLVAFVARIVMIPVFLLLHHKRKGSATTAAYGTYTDEYGVSRPIDTTNGAVPPTTASDDGAQRIVRTFLVATVAIVAILFILGIVTFAVQGAFFGVVGPYAGVVVAFWVFSIITAVATAGLLFLALRKLRGSHGDQRAAYDYGGAAVTGEKGVNGDHQQQHDVQPAPAVEHYSNGAPTATTTEPSYTGHASEYPQHYQETGAAAPSFPAPSSEQQHYQPPAVSRPLPTTPDQSSSPPVSPPPPQPLSPSIGSGIQPGSMYVAVSDGQGGTMMVPVSQQQQQQHQQQ